MMTAAAPPALHLRRAQRADAAAIAAIYNHYVRHTLATLQTEEASEADFAGMIERLPFMVAVTAATDGGSDDKMLGYCYADVMKSRCGYRYSYELSIYVDAEKTRGGVGKALMAEFLALLKDTTPAHRVVAVIGLPNPASVSLHEAFGFAHCGTLPAVGWKFDKWQDVGYWLLKLK